MLRFPYKLVTFDVNGTLLNVAAMGKTYAEIAKKHGVIADPQRIPAGFRSAYKMMDKKHPNFGVCDLGWKSWWTAVVKETFSSALDDKVGRTKMDAIAIDLIQHYSTGKPWILERGAIDILNRLKSQVTLGIISNTDPRLHGILKDHHLSKYFSFVLTSYEAGIAKPNVEIFNQASELYQKHFGSMLLEGEALHIGNSYELDFLAAQKAGWHSVLVNSQGPVDSNDCLVFKNLNELEDHVVKLNL